MLDHIGLQRLLRMSRERNLIASCLIAFGFSVAFSSIRQQSFRSKADVPLRLLLLPSVNPAMQGPLLCTAASTWRDRERLQGQHWCFAYLLLVGRAIVSLVFLAAVFLED